MVLGQRRTSGGRPTRHLGVPAPFPTPEDSIAWGSAHLAQKIQPPESPLRPASSQSSVLRTWRACCPAPQCALAGVVGLEDVIGPSGVRSHDELLDVLGLRVVNPELLRRLPKLDLARRVPSFLVSSGLPALTLILRLRGLCPSSSAFVLLDIPNLLGLLRGDKGTQVLDLLGHGVLGLRLHPLESSPPKKLHLNCWV